MKKQEQDARQFERLKTSSYQPTGDSNKQQDDALPKSKRITGKRIKLGLLLIAAVLFVTMIVLVTWSMRNFAVLSDKMFDGQSALKLLPTSPLETDAAGRTNVLIVGHAADRPEHGGSELTDTILLLSLDGTDGGYMLSIPRDLYIDIPEYGTAKINEAFPAGEQMVFQEHGYRDGGVGLLEKVVTENFGLDIHYQITTNFAAVEQLVDAVGGIEVTIDSPDERGIYDPNFQPHEGGPLRLKNGRQELDGQTALRLSRARGSAGGYGLRSDFGRTKNQQKVLAAIADELTWQHAVDPRVNGKLFNALAETTQTDLQMSEVIPMYRALTRVPVDRLESYTLRDINGVNLLTDYRNSNGQATLIPVSGQGNFEQIRHAINNIHK